MGLPQLVGLKCAQCRKAIGDITDGAFCLYCGNPVHLKCRQPGGTPISTGLCTACGGDAQSPIAIEVRGEHKRDNEPARLVCPNCGSTGSFRPMQSQEQPSLLFWIVFGLFWGLFVSLVPGAVTAGEYQCFKCQYVFRQRNRALELGCMLGAVLLLVGIVAMVVYSLWQ